MNIILDIHMDMHCHDEYGLATWHQGMVPLDGNDYADEVADQIEGILWQGVDRDARARVDDDGRLVLSLSDLSTDKDIAAVVDMLDGRELQLDEVYGASLADWFDANDFASADAYAEFADTTDDTVFLDAVLRVRRVG